ncbi:MAG: CopG family transcriptional regulator [Actinobacteria bacterium]|nr:CopG family transcriptional regulator [Actinomycetota bacterium]
MSHRTQIVLEDEQYKRLRRESAASGLSMGELVRQAIDAHFSRTSVDDRLGGLDQSFGAWKGRRADGEQFVEQVRSGLGAKLDT